MLSGLNQWATANADLAFFLGFIAIALVFHALHPFMVGLNCATSRRIRYADIDVGRQIRKPYRLGMLAGAVALFALLHFGLEMHGAALIAGSAVVGLLVVLDYVQLYRDYPARPRPPSSRLRP